MTTLGQTTELFEELEQLRMSRDWTYHQLGQAIEEVTHRHRADDCWRRICQGLTPNPHTRTLDILQTFLEVQRRRRSTNGRRKVS